MTMLLVDRILVFVNVKVSLEDPSRKTLATDVICPVIVDEVTALAAT